MSREQQWVAVFRIILRLVALRDDSELLPIYQVSLHGVSWTG